MKLSSWLALSFAATAGIAQPRVAADTADTARCDRTQCALKTPDSFARAKAPRDGGPPRVQSGADASGTTAREVLDVISALHRGDFAQWNLAHLRGP